ncbi:MAG TPA: Holliday junction branch migration protein RuvA [Acidimicrobiia bacterium]|nr:Holliday junction branch migration protein RuvA [Acidimicrobiia bacterium]
MIGSVRGSVLERAPEGEVLVEVGGVGYRVLVPLGALTGLAPKTNAFLFTHLHVRDDAMVLYGFPTRDERDTFEVLIAASGVGPKLALAILSVLSPVSLRRTMADADIDALTAVPGVGKRTAQKLMLELQSRLDVPDLDLSEGLGEAPIARAEARAALIELGYGTDEIRVALADLNGAQAAEALLKEALRRLAART